MADSGVVIPSEIQKVVGERTSLWKDFDKTQKTFAELEDLAQQVSQHQPATIPRALSDAKTPPAEISAASQKFHLEFKNIAKSQADIRTYQEEIDKIKQRRLIITIVVSLIAIGILCAIGSGVISLINTYL